MQSRPTNRLKNDTDALPAEINELIQQVAELPESNQLELEDSVQRVIEFTQRRRRILNLVQEALETSGQEELDRLFDSIDLPTL